MRWPFEIPLRWIWLVFALVSCTEADAGEPWTPPPHEHELPEHDHLHGHETPRDCLWECDDELSNCVFDLPQCPVYDSACTRKRWQEHGFCFSTARDCRGRCWGE